MLIHLFRGPGRIFGVTEAADGANLPARYAPWAAFKALEIEAGRAQPGLNVDECLEDLSRYGFHITDAHVRITDQAAAGTGEAGGGGE
jgi:hypothetical protein